MRNKFTLLMLATALFAASCKKENAQRSEGTAPAVIGDKIAPDGFNFSTTKNITVNVTLKANNEEVLSGVVVSVYASTTDSEPIYTGVTNKAGVLQAVVTVPASTTRIMINPAYVGLMHNAQAVITGNTVNAIIGGKNGFGGDVVAEEVNPTGVTPTSAGKSTFGLFTTEYGYPSGYSSSNAFVNTSTYPTKLGRPAYLETTGDVIDASLLSYVNASLPEGKPLSTTHPEFLTKTNVPDLNITAKSDVWITFVSEGAGNLNTLAYYTYSTKNPPSKSSGGTWFDGIDKITYIFPNTSAYGSGGGLKAGDKVKLGTFDAGTSIGFVLIANGWTGSGVAYNNTGFYTNPAMNPEKTLNKHSVLLYDDVHKLFLMGFEDLNREVSSDNDFNDLVVYATSNPVTGISNSGVSVIDDGGDKDGDGVLDELDAFPNDGTRAFISYYPSQTGYASIAFEDNWPNKGDYDLNDLVVNYRYTFTKNASNQVVDLKGEYMALASGASFKNGFGVQLPIAASAVKAVTGQKWISNYITLASNGVEAGQTKAVIIPFDNHEALLRNVDGSYFINTYMDKAKVTSDVATVNISLITPVPEDNLQVSNFNPFLISNLRRGYEIHLPGKVPTDKADSKLFGTSDDTSVPASGKYYISKENWPWAISFTNQFTYPVELQNITGAYLHFTDWAQSGGTSYTDWYSNTGTGYRNTSKLFTK